VAKYIVRRFESEIRRWNAGLCTKCIRQSQKSPQQRCVLRQYLLKVIVDSFTPGRCGRRRVVVRGKVRALNTHRLRVFSASREVSICRPSFSRGAEELSLAWLRAMGSLMNSKSIFSFWQLARVMSVVRASKGWRGRTRRREMGDEAQGREKLRHA